MSRRAITHTYIVSADNPHAGQFIDGIGNVVRIFIDNPPRLMLSLYSEATNISNRGINSRLYNSGLKEIDWSKGRVDQARPERV